MKLTDVQNNMALKRVKNYGNWSSCVKYMGNRTQWPCL